MRNEFKGMEKIILNNEKEKFIFYTDCTWKDYKKLTFLVDENDNVLDFYCGRNPKLYKNILFIEPNSQHGIYLDIYTGEQLFKDLTESYNNRCFSEFKYGYATFYNDKTNTNVFNTNGMVVKSYRHFRMISENRGIAEIQNNKYNTLTMVDKDFNIIKENCFESTRKMNGMYIISNEGTSDRNSLYYLFDYDGNKLSEGFTTLETTDFILFKTRKKGQGNKIVELKLEEVLL